MIGLCVLTRCHTAQIKFDLELQDVKVVDHSYHDEAPLLPNVGTHLGSFS